MTRFFNIISYILCTRSHGMYGNRFVIISTMRKNSQPRYVETSICGRCVLDGRCIVIRSHFLMSLLYNVLVVSTRRYRYSQGDTRLAYQRESKLLLTF